MVGIKKPYQTEKVCSKCKKLLPRERFSVRKTGRLNSECKTCKWKNRRSYMKKYLKDYGLKRYYGIGTKELKTMLKEQNYKCAICGTGISMDTRHVDHDHKTKQVRGLLCHNCNHGLGHFRDNPDFFVKAIDYLKLKGSLKSTSPLT